MKENDLLSCLILHSGLDAKPSASHITDTASWSVSLDIPVREQRILQPVDHTALPYKITVFCTKNVLTYSMKPQHNILEVLTAVMKIEICYEVWLCRLVNSYRYVKGSQCLHLQVQIVQDEGNSPCFPVRLEMTFHMILTWISHFRRCNSEKTAADFAFWVGSRARLYTQEKRKISFTWWEWKLQPSVVQPEAVTMPSRRQGDHFQDWQGQTNDTIHRCHG